MSDPADSDGQRLDLWMHFARIAKSRSLAQALIEGGKVRVNRDKTNKPSHKLKVGDVLTMTLGPRVRICKVLAFGKRRGPASEAQALLEDLSPRPAATASGSGSAQSASAASSGASPANHVSAEELAMADHGLRPAGAGRPTKRDRRAIARLKDQSI
ncbi:MAG: RNA-binding S4 domain-containing protein [Hyphomicrobium sp.]